MLRLCSAAGVPVVPQGGNTGLVGGSVPAADPGDRPAPGRAVDSTAATTSATSTTCPARSRSVRVPRSATCAGTRPLPGWSYGVDLAARDSATIGGTVATNAGRHPRGRLRHDARAGRRRRGRAGRRQCRLAPGRACSRTTPGYDLGLLLCGSEGTLGVITAVRLRLHRPVGRTSGGAHRLRDLRRVDRAHVVRRCPRRAPHRCGGDRRARAWTSPPALRGTSWPLERRHPLVVTLEVADGGDASGLVGVDDARRRRRASTPRSRRACGSYREAQGEAFSALGLTHKLDVSVPLPAWLPAATSCGRSSARIPSVTSFGVFGHLADGNIHVEMHGPAMRTTSRPILRSWSAWPAMAARSRRARRGSGQGARSCT